jgi:hypothetical protein
MVNAEIYEPDAKLKIFKPTISLCRELPRRILSSTNKKGISCTPLQATD